MSPEKTVVTSHSIMAPDTGVDSILHLSSSDSASSRDSLMFISLVRTVGLAEANKAAKAFRWDLSALSAGTSQKTELA
jgi:hypothetical protein